MKHSKCLLLLPLIFSFSACSQQTDESEPTSFEPTTSSHNYDEVREFELMWETMFDVDLDDYYIYFYSTTCNHCEDLKNYIIEKALTEENIYFIRGSSKDQIGKDPKMSKYAENPGDIWILGYPSLLEIVDHKCMKNLAGISQIKGELI